MNEPTTESRYCSDCTEQSPTAFDGACVHHWAESARTIRDPNDGQTTMRCILSKCIQEAVKLAIIDCVGGDQMNAYRDQYPNDTWEQTFARCDEERAEWLRDIYAVPDTLWALIDAGALASNVACRLIGYGGWTVGGIYGGNGTIQQIVDATFARPDQDHIAEIAFDMGLQPSDNGTESP